MRYRHEPTVEGDTIHLWGVGPECPGCRGSTHAVTGADDAEKPWWCQDCNVRFDDDGNYGSQAGFPAGSEPSETD